MRCTLAGGANDWHSGRGIISITCMSNQDTTERIDPIEAVAKLRRDLVAVRHQLDRWRDWALELESQMRREGWSTADFDSVWLDRPE